MGTTFLNRPLQHESDISRHRLDVNPEALQFGATDSGATEAEYLALIEAFVGVFKPTHLLETGTWNGDGAASLLEAAPPTSTVLTMCHHRLGDAVQSGLEEIARRRQSQLQVVEVNTLNLMSGNAGFSWQELTGGKTTFAFLDSSLPDRAQEFAYISDASNGVLDFSRPLCVFIHDVSRYRHPHDADTNSLANTLVEIQEVCEDRGWQALRVNQSRGMMILTKYPESVGIDGTCIVPDALIAPEDRAEHMRGSDAYLITDYYPILRDIVQRLQPKRVLEVGVRYGYSLATMLDAAATIEHVFAVDLPVSSDTSDVGQKSAPYARAQDHLMRWQNEGRWPSISILTFEGLDMRSVTELPCEIDELDLAYLDAHNNESECLHDLSLVVPRMRDGGTIVIDDADHSGLREIVEEWAAQRQWATLYYPDSSGRGRISITVDARALRERELAAMENSQQSIFTAPYPMKVVTHDRGGFSELTNSNVLIYFPHGFGDWVHFSHIMPYLEKSNNYWMVRYGDDNTSVMSGSAFCEPLYLGVKSTHCSDGRLFGNEHFGIEYNKIDGSTVPLALPVSLHDECTKSNMDTVLFTAFPESWGGSPYPFHTKARGVLQSMVPETVLNAIDLLSPLKNALSFDVPAWITQWVEAKLKNFTGFGERKLCLVGRNGYTSTDKNWGHMWRTGEDGTDLPQGEECREFMRLMLQKDKHWMFLVMEDRMFEGEDTVRSKDFNCFSYAELFGTPDNPALPFGFIMKALANCADLSIGVPAGAHHLCMVKDGLPCVGIWIDHCPSWYDEPKAESIHVLSRHLKDRKMDTRPGSFTSRDSGIYRTMPLDTRRVYGERVLEAVEVLLDI